MSLSVLVFFMEHLPFSNISNYLRESEIIVHMLHKLHFINMGIFMFSESRDQLKLDCIRGL